MEIEFHKNVLNVKQHLDILTSNIQAKIDPDRVTRILQNPVYPGPQPSALSRPIFGWGGLVGRRQLSHPFNSSNHRSNEVPHVNLASTTEESNGRWRRMLKCTICMQLGHMEQTHPRPYPAQPPPQQIRGHTVYKLNHVYEQRELIPRIIPRSHNTTSTLIPEQRNSTKKEVEIMPRSPNTALAPVPEPKPLTVASRPNDDPRRRTFLRHCSNCKGLNHNILQCPFLPCKFCNKLGHVSLHCQTRLSNNRESHRKSKEKSRAKRSLIKRQTNPLERLHGLRESPSKGEASDSKLLLTAADQPVRIEGEVDVEMTKDQ